MIKEFKTKEKGYHPFIIEDGWQLAKLNYTEEQHINNISHLDVHLETDEVFVAIAGKAVLIAAEIVNNEPQFELEPMTINQIYNIPKGVWHNIAMEEGSEVLIAEKSNTHIADFEHLALSDSKRKELEILVKGKLELLII